MGEDRLMDRILDDMNELELASNIEALFHESENERITKMVSQMID